MKRLVLIIVLSLAASALATSSLDSAAI